MKCYEDLTGYEKIKLLLENYVNLKDRLNYLKSNIDNIKLKQGYKFNEVKAFNISYLSDIEKIEDIKERRLKSIELLEYFTGIIEAGIKYIKNYDCKYYEIIELYYIKRFNLSKIAKVLKISSATVSKNRDKLINEMADFIYFDFSKYDYLFQG